ncbi:hypothetical protein ACIP5Y_35125 [Nocardia sp. NPDC088792]
MSLIELAVWFVAAVVGVIVYIAVGVLALAALVYGASPSEVIEPFRQRNR